MESLDEYLRNVANYYLSSRDIETVRVKSVEILQEVSESNIKLQVNMAPISWRYSMKVMHFRGLTLGLLIGVILGAFLFAFSTMRN